MVMSCLEEHCFSMHITTNENNLFSPTDCLFKNKKANLYSDNLLLPSVLNLPSS